jgi:hypothetical protein
MGLVKFLCKRNPKKEETKFVAKPLGTEKKSDVETKIEEKSKVVMNASPRQILPLDAPVRNFGALNSNTFEPETYNGYIVSCMTSHMQCELAGHSRIDGRPIFKIKSNIQIPNKLRDKFDFSIIQNLADGTNYLSTATRWDVPDFYVVKVMYKC